MSEKKVILEDIIDEVDAMSISMDLLISKSDDIEQKNIYSAIAIWIEDISEKLSNLDK